MQITGISIQNYGVCKNQSFEDIQSAIEELDPYSATPDGDIPAKILCSCKESLALPLCSGLALRSPHPGRGVRQ